MQKNRLKTDRTYSSKRLIDARHRGVRMMLSRLFQYLIFTFFASIVCFIGFSLFLILISYILNWGDISLSEVKDIVLFFFNVFSKGFPLLFLSILISDNLKRR